MNRRHLLISFSAVLASSMLGRAWAHTPFRQWAVFRQRFLLITTTRDDPGSDELGEEIARILLALLPASHAQVSRARDWKILASLISTHQTEVAVMARERAAALLTGADPYRDYGAVPLRIIIQNEKYALVCREDFPVHHAYLLSEALMQEAREQGFAIPDETDAGKVLPVHPGALAFARGESLPAAPVNEKEVRRAQ